MPKTPEQRVQLLEADIARLEALRLSAERTTEERLANVVLDVADINLRLSKMAEVARLTALDLERLVAHLQQLLRRG